MGSISNKPVAATPTSLEINGAVLSLKGQVIMTVCTAGENVAILLDSGELKIYSAALQLLTSRDVAIPGEWFSKPPLLTASHDGSTIAIGVTGQTLILYSFENNALGHERSIYLPPFVEAIGLIASAPSAKPSIWSFTQFRKDTSSIKIEPFSESAINGASRRLPLQGSPVSAIFFDTSDEGCVLIYDEEIRYVSMQDVMSGRTSLRSFPLSRVTTWCKVNDLGSTKAFLIAKSQLYSIKIVDGTMHVDLVPTDMGEFKMSAIEHFQVLSIRRRLHVEYTTRSERGRFSISSSGEVSDREVVSRLYRDFAFTETKNRILTTVKHPSGLGVVLQTPVTPVLAEYKHLCPRFLTNLFYIPQAKLLIVSSVTEALIYRTKGQTFEHVRTLDEPVLAAKMTRDSLIIATPERIKALGTYYPHDDIIDMKLPLDKVSIGEDLIVAILENNKVYLIDPGLDTEPRELDPINSTVVLCAKEVQPGSLVVSYDFRGHQFDAATLEITEPSVCPAHTTDCISVDGKLWFATADGRVKTPQSTHVVSDGPLSFVTLTKGGGVLVKSDQLYLVDNYGVSPISFSDRMAPQRVKAICELGDSTFMVASEHTMLKVKLVPAPTTAAPTVRYLPTPKKVNKVVIAQHVRAIIVSSGNRLSCFDGKHYKPLTIVGLKPESVDDMCEWTTTHMGNTFYHLVVFSKTGEDAGLIRTYAISRQRQTLTFQPRMKQKVDSNLSHLVASSKAISYICKGLEEQLASILINITESDGLKLTLGRRLDIKVGVEHVVSYGRRLYVAGDAGLFVYEKGSPIPANRTVDSKGRVLTVPERCHRCLVFYLNGQVTVCVATNSRTFIILNETEKLEYHMEQALTLPDRVAEMHISKHVNAVRLMLLLQNSDLIEIL